MTAPASTQTLALPWTSSKDGERPGSLVWETSVTDSLGTYRVLVVETGVGEWQYMQYDGESDFPSVMSQDFPTSDACKAAYEADLAAAADLSNSS